MTQHVYKFDDKFKKLIKDTGYKHIAMESPEGERIVSYNQPKQTIEKKFDEIRRRLNVLPDGFYKIMAQYNYSGKSKPDIFILQKGNPPKDQLEEDAPVPVRTVTRRTPDEKSREEILSLPEALKRIEELSKLRVENANLLAQVKQLQEENASLEAELEAMPEPNLAEAQTDPAMKWLENILPAVSPFFDKYFDLRNRQLDHLERQYQQPVQQKKKVVVHSGRAKQHPTHQEHPDNFAQFPINDENAINELLDEMEKLDDAQFEFVYTKMNRENPALAEIVHNEFFGEDEQNMQEESEQ